MKKIVSIIKFIKTSNQKCSIIFWILRELYYLPAFIFHEAMHLIMLYVFSQSWEIRKLYFFTIKENYLKSYALEIQYNPRNAFIGFTVSAMPIIGWLFCVFYFIFTFKPFLLFYFITSIKTFYYSKCDIIAMKQNGCNQWICQQLLLIHKILFTK